MTTRRSSPARRLTNERLNKRFANSFELVDYAIKRAERMIASGKAPEDEESDILNPAFHILEEIAEGRDVLEPVIAAERKVVDTTLHTEVTAPEEASKGNG